MEAAKIGTVVNPNLFYCTQSIWAIGIFSIFIFNLDKYSKDFFFVFYFFFFSLIVGGVLANKNNISAFLAISVNIRVRVLNAMNPKKDYIHSS